MLGTAPASMSRARLVICLAIVMRPRYERGGFTGKQTLACAGARIASSSELQETFSKVPQARC